MKKTQSHAGHWLMLVLGAAILAFGLFNVHAQSCITEGGVLGATLLIRHWLGITPAVSEVVLDVLCYGLGLRFLGKDFLRKAIVATGCYAFFYAVNERIGYILPDMSAMPILAALTGGLFVGVGVGLVVRAGGAAGGDDALALVIAKVFGVNVSRAYLITDTIVLLLSLSYIPLRSIACSLMTVMLSSFIIGKIHTFGTKNPQK